jgi:hypothetical protein
MAPHGKELTTEQKEIILFFSNEGFSSYKIQNMTGVPFPKQCSANCSR